ncbi:MAG: hypothetical protein ACREEN_01685, partial [Stellaceae bacterium]
MAFLATAMILTACGSNSGTAVPPAQMAQFRVGVTTYDQVIQALGPPTASTTTSDGTRMLVYSHVQSTVSGATFIQI